MEQRDAAVRTYFKSMMEYKVSRLTSRLAVIQNDLVEKSETMNIRQMDAVLNFLEDLRRTLEDFKG